MYTVFLEYTQLKILWWSCDGERAKKRREESKSQQKSRTRIKRETRLRMEGKRENICCSRFPCVCWRSSWFRWFAIHFVMEKGDRPAKETSSQVEERGKERSNEWSSIQRRTEFTGFDFLDPPNLCFTDSCDGDTLVNTDNYICTQQLVTALNLSKKLNRSFSLPLC